ncbi:fungal-specific transcription factor domain-containing protein [Staphylotrichum tortipilum]|uniref:Fungal-specific transcription factor domain-containing protein n=1 Tax=Staphylotrichum tortipilum TaxID=2831512 RepID=A0AAN6RUI4_9PEZI|nr:fungal-specific transcription factor domain-containing protein [Staphylotrichum longicolle]
MSARSRQGCDECRRRRRKCDEKKPCCGPCSAFNRSCRYTLRVVWAGHRAVGHGGTAGGNYTISPNPGQTLLPPTTLPRHLPNGIPLSPRYQKLLNYFALDILASLSCHPSIHHDLRQGLVPATLESPQLMSACLALSAAGYLSRGVLSLDGVEISKILGHLQSSGLPLLRGALETGQMNDNLLATCLIWCLTDVFAYQQGTSSWRIHLQGVRALLDGDSAHRGFTTPSGATQSAMKHLYQLYLSLRTLPYIPASEISDPPGPSTPPPPNPVLEPSPNPPAAIDGFLGYSAELLSILHQIDRLSRSSPPSSPPSPSAAPLLARVQSLITRDTHSPPAISIPTPLSPEYTAEFALCHQTFQQATLIQLYRRLYHLPSRAAPIQAAVRAMRDMLGRMGGQGRPCHAWVAMAMPLFTMGCEAYTEGQRAFALEKVGKLEECIGSFHVAGVRRALWDVWGERERVGDEGRGEVCAGRLLGE